MTARRKPDDRRREIADAALQIIAERGLARLTAAEIAREVGVTDAALFHHFRGMDEILLAVVDRVEDVLFEEHGQADAGDPLARLGTFFLQRVATLQRNPGAGRLVSSDVLSQVAPPPGVTKMRALKSRSVRVIGVALEEAQAEGLLAEGFDVPEATVLVLGALMALTQAPKAVAGGSTVAALGERVWRHLDGVLRKRTLHAVHEGAARPAHGRASVAAKARVSRRETRAHNGPRRRP